MAMNRVLMVVPPEKFRDEELSIPRQVLEDMGAKVTLVSTRAGKITGMFSAEAQAQDIKDVAGETFGAVIVVGGSGSPALWDHTLLHQIIRAHHAAGRPVAAICLSGAVLARAGILKGVEAVVFKSEASMKVFRECGVAYREKPVVVSGNIITASGPAAAREFALAVAGAMGLAGAPGK